MRIENKQLTKSEKEVEEMEEKREEGKAMEKEGNTIRDIVVYIGAITVGIIGILILETIFPALGRPGKLEGLSILLLFLIPWLVTYFFTKSHKKALISIGLTALVLIFILIYFSIAGRMIP